MGLNTNMFNILEQKRIFLTLSTMRGVSLYYNMQSLSLHSNISLFNRNRKRKRGNGNCCRRLQGTGCHREFTESAGGCESVLWRMLSLLGPLWYSWYVLQVCKNGLRWQGIFTILWLLSTVKWLWKLTLNFISIPL